MPVVVRRAVVGEILELRHAILRPGFPRAAAVFAGDEDAGTCHLAAFLEDGRVVGCLSLHESSWEGRAAYQLRGMATAADLRRQGVGRQLLQAADAFVRARAADGPTSPRLMWCNARIAAVPFYLANGWRGVSEEFDIPTVGPHVRMVRAVEG